MTNQSPEIGLTKAINGLLTHKTGVIGNLTKSAKWPKGNPEITQSTGELCLLGYNANSPGLTSIDSLLWKANQVSAPCQLQPAT